MGSSWTISTKNYHTYFTSHSGLFNNPLLDGFVVNEDKAARQVGRVTQHIIETINKSSLLNN